jgi:hypothetical protein
MEQNEELLNYVIIIPESDRAGLLYSSPHPQWRNQGAANEQLPIAFGDLPIVILLFQHCLFIFEIDSNCNVINRVIKNRLKHVSPRLKI